MTEVGAVAFAGMTVEFQFGDVATGIGGTDIAHIAEAGGTIDICMGDYADCAFLLDDVEWQRIQEVLAVGAFENA